MKRVFFPSMESLLKLLYKDYVDIKRQLAQQSIRFRQPALN